MDRIGYARNTERIEKKCKRTISISKNYWFCSVCTCVCHAVWLVHAVSYFLHIQQCSIYILLIVSTPPILNLYVLPSRCPFWLHSLDNNAVEPFSKNISFKTISETAFHKKEPYKEGCVVLAWHNLPNKLVTFIYQEKYDKITGHIFRDFSILVNVSLAGWLVFEILVGWHLKRFGFLFKFGWPTWRLIN